MHGLQLTGCPSGCQHTLAPTHTCAGTGGTPSSLISLPHPDRLRLRGRKLGAMNLDSRFKGEKPASHTLGRLPVTSPPQQGSLLPTVFPPHSARTSAFIPNILMPTGAWEIRSTEKMPLALEVSVEEDTHRESDNGSWQKEPWGSGLTQPWVRGVQRPAHVWALKQWGQLLIERSNSVRRNPPTRHLPDWIHIPAHHWGLPEGQNT